MAVRREERIEIGERKFECPNCHKQTTHWTPMDTIRMARSVCEHCKKEYLIVDDVPMTEKKRPHSIRHRT